MSMIKAKVDEAAVTAARDSAAVLEAEIVGETVSEVSDEVSTAVAIHVSAGNNSPPALKDAHAFSALISILEESGMGGLELGYRSFPNIALKEEFTVSSGQSLPNSGFDVIIIGSRAKFSVNSAHDREEDSEVTFAYDIAEISNKDSVVAAKIAEWKELGVGYTVKQYAEVWAYLVDDKGDGSLNNEICVLSVSPSSREILSGYIPRLRLKHKRSAQAVVTRVSRGVKVGTGRKAFYPWNFEFVRDAAAEEMEALNFSN